MNKFLKRFVKRLFIIPVLSIFMFFLCGMIMSPGTSTPDEPVVLCKFGEKISGPASKILIVLEANEDIISDELGSIPYIDTNGDSHNIEVNWNITDTALLEPGFHNIIGTPILTENMSLAEGFDGIVTWPMYRKGGAEPVTAIPDQQPFYLFDSLIPLGSNDPFREIDLKTAGRRFAIGTDAFYNTDESWIWTWDFSQVDTSRTGSYTVTGSLTSPEWIFVPNEYTTASFPVHVMPDDKIEIFAPSSILSDGALEFKWIYDSSHVTEVRLEQEMTNGEWTVCDETWYDYKSPTMFAPGKFLLKLLNIPSDNMYTFRLCYLDDVNGESLERTTDPLYITIPANIEEIVSTANGSIPKELDVGGDRNGEDEPGSDLPNYDQPAPTPEVTPTPEIEPTPEVTPIPEIAPTVTPSGTPDNTTENTPGKNTETGTVSGHNNSISKFDSNLKSELETKSNPATESEPEKKQNRDVVKEEVTDTYTAISGLRLKQLCSSGATVLFEKNGVTAEIPSSLLEKLALDDYDLLEVTILHPKKNTIQISVLAKGIPIDDLSGTVIYLPWNETKGTELKCQDSTGNQMLEVFYDASNGIAKFEIDAPGTYTISEYLSDSNDSMLITASPTTLILGISIATLFLVIILVILLQRRRGHE